MDMQSYTLGDVRTRKTRPGAYEWWYFDAISNDGSVEIVAIFYEGNPFSRRYIQHQQNGQQAKAYDFPAVSISIYNEGRPVFYSFTEFSRDDAHFADKTPGIAIADHRMEGRVEGDQLIYTLQLNETLPSGDRIKAHLEFKSRKYEQNLLANAIDVPDHQWNLVQPKAAVRGQINCTSLHGERHQIVFNGTGYHDHNIGCEPLKEQFNEWYWGRFHFNKHTFLYYLSDHQRMRGAGWLLNKNGETFKKFGKLSIKDYSHSIYGLNTGRKIVFKNGANDVTIQQSQLLDDGPFYQRFSSTAFLSISDLNCMKKGRGITEYLSPPRIYAKRFWPLTNMRIRYKAERPHWVQKSKRLYRWTW